METTPNSQEGVGDLLNDDDDGGGDEDDDETALDGGITTTAVGDVFDSRQSPGSTTEGADPESSTGSLPAPKQQWGGNTPESDSEATLACQDEKEPTSEDHSEPAGGGLPVPPDGGWGWMIVLGCFLMHVLVGGWARGFSIIYIELRRMYGTSAALTAWVGGLTSALRFGLGPVASTLSNRFGARRVILVGALISGVGSILCAFASSTEYMFFSYSLMTGVGGALCYCPAVVVVGQYFNRRRSIAMGISTCGSGFGAFLFPLLIQLLYGVYGYSGGMLILGAIEMNLLVSGALYRPLEASRSPLSPLTRTVRHADPVENRRKHECAYQRDSREAKASKTALSQSLTSNADDDQNKSRSTETSCCANTSLNKYIDFHLWRKPTFVCFALCLALITLSYISGQMLVPDHARDLGVSDAKAALLLSVIGIADTFGRLLSGFVFSIACIKKRSRRFYILAIVLSSLTNLSWGLCRGFNDLAVVSVLHGTCNGAVVSQRSVITADLLGVENLSSAFGFIVGLQGIALLLGPPIAGGLKDVTHYYTASFVFTGGAGLVGAAILSAEWFLHGRHKARRNAGPQQSATC